jgi:hypothetical protein
MSIDDRQPPWQQGYEAAAQVRYRLGLGARRISSVSTLGEVLGLDAGEWQQAHIGTRHRLDFLDAAVALTRRGGALFTLRSRLETARTFATCRALFEYLDSHSEAAALVAPTYSARQKRNRAFAAELLAPADTLRRGLSGQVVTEEEVDTLAGELEVSSYVVRHQIENHELARIIG